MDNKAVEKVAKLSDFYKDTQIWVSIDKNHNFDFTVRTNNGKGKSVIPTEILDKLIAEGYTKLIIDHAEIDKVIKVDFINRRFEKYLGPNGLTELLKSQLKNAVNFEIGCEMSLTITDDNNDYAGKIGYEITDVPHRSLLDIHGFEIVTNYNY